MILFVFYVIFMRDIWDWGWGGYKVGERKDG
jgi:hypothetical protein